MPFEFDTEFPATDPRCEPRFTRTFEHTDWIDGESIVQAEATPTEEGFNSRFHKIRADLDALADDARRGLLCAADMRTSLHALITELERTVDKLTTSITAMGVVEDWTDATLLNGWRFQGLDTDYDYNRPGWFRDRFGMVHLRGTARGGPVPSSANGFNSIMFTLPVGYRPPNRTVLSCLTSGNAVVRLDIQDDGNVNVRGAFSTWVCLDGLSFRMAARSIIIDIDTDILGGGGVVLPGGGGIIGRDALIGLLRDGG